MAFKFTEQLEQTLKNTKKDLELTKQKMVKKSSLVPAAQEGVKLGNAIKGLFKNATEHADTKVNDLSEEVGKFANAVADSLGNHKEGIDSLEQSHNKMAEKINQLSETTASVHTTIAHLNQSVSSSEDMNPHDITDVEVCGDASGINCLSIVENNT